jgi:DNA polymerase III delta prime subunit
LITKNINASITDNDIVAFIVKNNLLEKDEKIGYDEIEDDLEQDSYSRTQTISNINIPNNEIKNEENDKFTVVFFDEFNTCNSQGLLTEIMCEHRVQGKKIRKNVSFIGACNPYRKKIIKQDNTALIKTTSKFSNLVYTVNPLTHSQLYLVLNFGVLSQEDEKKYIESIAEYELKTIIKNEDIYNKVHPLMVKAFLKSQEIIREKNGKESVSLREIRKFLIIYKFMYKDFKKKQNLQISNENENDESKLKLDFTFYQKTRKEEIIHKYAISVGIFICFYIRLQLQDKPNFESELLEILDLQLLEYPEKLQNELVKNIEFERGIAANNILKLNLFITFIGILTRIAVFLVGPPGCSKTLCLNLIKKSMQGVNSQNQFWKQYPQLIVTSFQGSLTCTSTAIKKLLNML